MGAYVWIRCGYAGQSWQSGTSQWSNSVPLASQKPRVPRLIRGRNSFSKAFSDIICFYRPALLHPAWRASVLQLLNNFTRWLKHKVLTIFTWIVPVFFFQFALMPICHGQWLKNIIFHCNRVPSRYFEPPLYALAKYFKRHLFLLDISGSSMHCTLPKSFHLTRKLRMWFLPFFSIYQQGSQFRMG